jgi:hypothetical protein
MSFGGLCQKRTHRAGLLVVATKQDSEWALNVDQVSSGGPGLLEIEDSQEIVITSICGNNPSISLHLGGRGLERAGSHRVADGDRHTREPERASSCGDCQPRAVGCI